MSLVPYASAVGLHIYAMVCTRPDLAYIVSTVSRFMLNLEKESSEVGATISTRDYETRHGILEIENRKV